EEMGEEAEDRARLVERSRHRIRLLRRCVDGLRYALRRDGRHAGLTETVALKRCSRDDHQVHWNRLRLSPCPLLSRFAGARRDERAVGNDSLPSWSAHAPRDGRLLTWVVEARNPVARAIRPVVAEVRPAPRAVVPRDQTVGDGAAIFDRDHRRVADTRAWQRDDHAL